MDFERLISLSGEFGVSQEVVRRVILEYCERRGYKHLHMLDDGSIVVDAKLTDKIRRRDRDAQALVLPSHIVQEGAVKYIPLIREPAVYFLLRGSKIVYVGQSVWILSRMATHVQDKGKDFDRVYIHPARNGLLDVFEGVNINYHKPEYNKVGMTPLEYFRWIVSDK